jgi:glycerol-3-phosphate acyltransferase PlsY
MFFGLLAVFIILRHRENIARLLAGKESKFAKKKP